MIRHGLHPGDRLLANQDLFTEKVEFRVLRELGRGASCIAYEAQVFTVSGDLIETGVLKEFYPIKYQSILQRDEHNFLRCSIESEEFSLDKESFLHVYNYLQGITNAGEDTRFSSFIPLYKIYCSENHKLGVPYIFSPKMEMEVFDDFLKKCENDSSDKLLSLFHILFDILNLTECVSILHGDNSESSECIVVSDIKPTNFGICKRGDNHLGTLSYYDLDSFYSEGTLMDHPSGTDSFRDPAIRRFGYCRQTDIYSIGCVLIYALIGSQAFYSVIDFRNADPAILTNNSYILQPLVFSKKDRFLLSLNNIIHKCIGQFQWRYSRCSELIVDLKELVAMITPMILNKSLPVDYQWYLIDNDFYIQCDAVSLFEAQKHQYLYLKTRGRFSQLNISKSIMSNAIEGQPANTICFSSVVEDSTSRPTPLVDIIKSNEKSLFIYGEGGMGKTTMCASILAEYYEKDLSFEGEIPIYIDLSMAADTLQKCYLGKSSENWIPNSLVEPELRSSFILRTVFSQLHATQAENKNQGTDSFYLAMNGPWDLCVKPVYDLLGRDHDRHIFLICDGLNEIPSSKILSNNFITPKELIIKELLELAAFDNVRIVVTSRSFQEVFEKSGFATYSMIGLDDAQIRKYLLANQFSTEEVNSALSNKELRDVLKIPLFLTLYSSISKRKGLATKGEILRTFLTERQNNYYSDPQRLLEINQNIEKSSGAFTSERFTVDRLQFLFELVLPTIAFSMFQKSQISISLPEIGSLILNLLKGDPTDPMSILGKYSQHRIKTEGKNVDIISTANDLLSMITESDEIDISYFLLCLVDSLAILVLKGNRIFFIHQNICEHFACAYIVNQMHMADLAFRDENTNASLDERQCRALKALECINTEVLPEYMLKYIGEYLGEHRNEPYQTIDGTLHYNVDLDHYDQGLLSRLLNIYRGRF